jgi:hypothetical protein
MKEKKKLVSTECQSQAFAVNIFSIFLGKVEGTNDEVGEDYWAWPVFDLIPANYPDGRPNPIQTRPCHVDELGKCRNTLNIRDRG